MKRVFVEAGIVTGRLKWRRTIFCFLVFVACSLPDSNVFARTTRTETDLNIRPFHLRELTGALDLRGEYEDDRQGPEFRERQTRFEERIDLRGKGSVYHPNFLQFDFGVSLGLGQEMFRGNFNGNNNTFLNEYNLNLCFLQKKPYTFSLFTDHSSNTVGRQYFGPITIDYDSYGGIAHYQTIRYSATLQAMSQRTKEDAVDFRRDRTEKSADLRVTGNVSSELSNEFRYLYKDTEEQLSSTQRISTQDITLYTLWDKKKFHGVSTLSWLATSGSVDTDNFRANEYFRLEHTDTFTTLYNYNFSRFVAGGFGSETHLGSAGFRHKLYESLTTEVRGEGGLTDATEFNESYYGPSLNFSYVKSVPGGIFTGGYGFLYRRTERETAAGAIRVFAEAITLSDGSLTILANPGVLPGTVVVRDTFGAVLQEDVDYRLITSGSVTEIQRVALPNDTPVLVDYDYSFPRSLSYDTVSHTLSLRYDFKQFLSFYFNHLSIRHGSVSGTGIYTTETALYNTKRTLEGVELKWRSLVMGGEYEVDDSDLTPYTAWRLRGSFSTPLTDYASLGLGASRTKTDYERERTTTTFTDVSLHLRAFLFGNTETSLESGYLMQKGRGTDTRALRIKGEARSRFRAVELKLRAEYLNRKEFSQDRDELLVKFNLIRYFNIF